jgi:hypothetical protein
LVLSDLSVGGLAWGCQVINNCQSNSGHKPRRLLGEQKQETMDPSLALTDDARRRYCNVSVVLRLCYTKERRYDGSSMIDKRGGKQNKVSWPGLLGLMR